MNILFSLLFLLCTFLLLCVSPDTFLPSILDGASRGASVSVALIANYSIWMGLMRIWEDSGVARSASKLLRPLVKRVFKTDHEEALQTISMNLSVNLLGISGAATPYGIRSAQLLDQTENAEYASAMLFVLNATSLQIIPTSIVSVRVGMLSANPYDIILPTIFASLLSTIVGVTLTRLFIRPKTEAKQPSFFFKKVKTRGVSI
jgi:spore maturation protein A